MNDAPDLAAAIAAGDARHSTLRAQLASRRTALPLRYWRQQAHFTTPASDAAMARKAVEGGTAAVPRMLERLGLTGADLAERLELDHALVEARLAGSARAPLVMLDGEDAIAPGDGIAARAMAAAADILTEADWGTAGEGSLRFYRPPDSTSIPPSAIYTQCSGACASAPPTSRPSRSTASSFPKSNTPRR